MQQAEVTLPQVYFQSQACLATHNCCVCVQWCGQRFRRIFVFRSNAAGARTLQATVCASAALTTPDIDQRYTEAGIVRKKSADGAVWRTMGTKTLSFFFEDMREILKRYRDYFYGGIIHQPSPSTI